MFQVLYRPKAAYRKLVHTPGMNTLRRTVYVSITRSAIHFSSTSTLIEGLLCLIMFNLL